MLMYKKYYFDQQHNYFRKNLMILDVHITIAAILSSHITEQYEAGLENVRDSMVLFLACLVAFFGFHFYTCCFLVFGGLVVKRTRHAPE